MLRFRRDDSAATNFFLSAGVWLVIGALMGVILTIEFVFPDFAHGISWLVFGRLRQAHVNVMAFAWLSAAMMGAFLYFVPRLTGRKLYSEVLGNICVVLWNLAMLVGIIGLLTGHTQSREYAELIWQVDVAVMVVFILNAFNVLMTIAKRVESKLYVSLWYITAAVVLFPIVYFIGNVMWNPPTGALTGINDTIFNWFYGHNLLGLWITIGLLAVIYYIVPKETGTPIFSTGLSLIGFWGILLFYTGVGAHHLLWAPIPHWLQTVAIAESAGMVIPVVAVLFNIMLTMRGNWSHLRSSVPLLYTLTGLGAYIVVSFQGTQMAFRGMNQLSHFTQYVPAHSHLGLLFFGASVCIGGAYYVIPRVFNCRLYSRRLARSQYAFYVIGFIAFFLGFVLAGLVQGSDWTRLGLPVWVVLPGLVPYFALRIMGGALLAISFIMFLYNLIATVVVRRPAEEPDAAVIVAPAARITAPPRDAETSGGGAV